VAQPSRPFTFFFLQASKKMADAKLDKDFVHQLVTFLEESLFALILVLHFVVCM